jgi:hypothetical protein
MQYNITFPLASGHSDSVYYFQCMNPTTGAFWNGTAMALSPDYADTVIAIPSTSAEEIGTMGVIGFSSPANLPAIAKYDVILRMRAGGSPAATDNIVSTKSIYKHVGGNIVAI